MRAVFRADASAETGGGHVMRCLALAGEMSAADWTCGFAVGPETLDTVPALADAGHPWVELDATVEDEVRALKERWTDGVDWLVVDHYGRDAAFEGACRPWAERIMVIDDLADRHHDCDVLLDQTLGRDGEDYGSLVPGDCRRLLGPRFALLRPQFREARAKALERRDGDFTVRHLLVSMGGSDPREFTSRVLKGIAEAAVAVEVDVVAPSAGSGQLRELAESLPFPIAVHADVADMAALMARADIAIGAAGSTSWERCCLGLPSLLIVTAENQRMIAERLEFAGAADGLGWHADVDAAGIAAALRRLNGDAGRRRQMSARAAEVCDGLGAVRVREQLS